MDRSGAFERKTEMSAGQLTGDSATRRSPAVFRDRLPQLLNRIVVYFFLCFGGIMVLMPLVWMISTSLKAQTQVFKVPPI